MKSGYDRVMRLWHQVKAFFNALLSNRWPPGRIEDSPEVELEKERKRGMRGL